jgi:hypothetical protein
VRAGVTVSATAREASVARIYASPSGRNSAPCTPVRRSTGTNTRATTKVA